MAVKIRLKRLGKIRSPHYRIVVADSRTKRDGRAIEEIGKYHPKNDPSVIEVDSERAQYWLSVGAQPTEAVVALFKRTGDWQKFSGDTSPVRGRPADGRRPNKTDAFNAALAEAGGEPRTAAISRRRRRAEGGRGRRSRAPRPRRQAAEPASLRRDRRRPSRGLTCWPTRWSTWSAASSANPDDVSVRDKDLRRGRMLEVRVNPEDIGKVIGRSGRTATALRTVIAPWPVASRSGSTSSTSTSRPGAVRPVRPRR